MLRANRSTRRSSGSNTQLGDSGTNRISLTRFTSTAGVSIWLLRPLNSRKRRILGKVFATCSPFRDARAKDPEKLGAFCGAEVVAANNAQQIAQAVFLITAPLLHREV